MSNIKGFGNRLKTAIRSSSYTQKEISEILRINQDTLSNYVKERSFPKADILHNLCDLLNISPDWLLTGEGEYTNFNTKFGERLRECLEKTGYSQKRATEELGLSKNTISNYLKGRIPETTILYKLSQLCNVTMEYLLTGEEPDKKENADQITWTIENYTIDGKPADPSSIFNPEKKPVLKLLWESFITLLKEESNVDIDKETIKATYDVIDIENDFPKLHKQIEEMKEIQATDITYIKEIVDLLKKLPPSELKEIKNYVNYRLQSYTEMNKGGRSSTFTHGEEATALDDATA